MIPLTTNVRLKRGLPPAVTSIILATLYMEICADYPNLLCVVILPLAGLLFFLYQKYKTNSAPKRMLLILGIFDLFLLFWSVFLAVIYPEFSFLSPKFSFFVPLIFRVPFQADAPDPADFFLSIFSHNDIWHWFWNAVYLWIFGSILEDRIGWKKFIGLFIACGIFATLLYWTVLLILVNILNVHDWHSSALGASGAISGIMGLTIFRFYNAKVRISGIPFLYWWTPFTFSVPIWFFTLYNLTQDVVTFFILRKIDHINHLAHLGGFIAGCIAGRWLKFDKENLIENQLLNAKTLLRISVKAATRFGMNPATCFG